MGPKPREIADTMGYDYDYVIEVANRIYASGMWTDSETRYSFNLTARKKAVVPGGESNPQDPKIGDFEFLVN